MIKYYYLVRNIKNDKLEVQESTLPYYEFRDTVEKIEGNFGRRKYAEYWRDFYNGDISREQLRVFMNL
jgi:hypothetical protein